MFNQGLKKKKKNLLANFRGSLGPCAVIVLVKTLNINQSHVYVFYVNLVL